MTPPLPPNNKNSFDMFMHNNLYFTDESSLDIAAEKGHSTVVKKLIETYEALKHLDNGKF